MSYRLGIDLGTTYTAAAVARGATAKMAALGDHTPEIPSVLAYLPDGEILVGDPAVRRVFTDPTRIAREFKRRLGDPVPIIVGGSPRSAEALTGALLRHIVDRVTRAEGGEPDSLIVTVPANWGPYKLSLMDQVFQLAGVSGQTMAEPVAAAHFYAHEGRVDDQATVVVFDFGGGTFDAAIVRRDGARFQMVGEAKGLERLGGVDLDHAVLDHALTSSAIDLGGIEETEEATAGLARLRQECTLAKEALSYDSSAAIPIMLPGFQTTVRLTRTEFEEMIRPSIHDAVTTVETMVSQAGLTPSEIDSVLLVGGSSRIPLVSQILSERLARPIVADAHPKHTIALGAALSTQTTTTATEPTPASPPSRPTTVAPQPPVQPTPATPTPTPSAPVAPTSPAQPEPVTATPTAPAVTPAATPSPGSEVAASEKVTSSTPLAGRGIYLAALAVALVLVGVGFLTLRSGENDEPQAASDTGSAQTTTQPAEADDPESVSTSNTTVPDEADVTETSEQTPTGPLDMTIGPSTRLENATSYSPTAKSFEGVGPAAAPSLLWETDTTGFSGAVGAGDLVFTFQPSGRSSTNQLVAYEGGSGQEVWTNPSEAVHNTVAARGGLVAISDAKETQILSIEAGNQLTAVVPVGLDSEAIHSSVVVRNGTAYAWGTARRDDVEKLYIVATDLASGETRWIFEDASSGNPFLRTVVNDDVIVADNEDFRAGIDAATGEELWRTTDVDDSILLLVDGGVMLVSTIGGELRALDARTQAELWTDSESVGLRAAGDGDTFYTTNFGYSVLIARRLIDGSPVWAQPVSTVGWEASGAITIVVDRDSVYTIVDDVATARSKATGELIWSDVLEGLGNDRIRNAAVADGRLLLVDESGMLRVYGVAP